MWLQDVQISTLLPDVKMMVYVKSVEIGWIRNVKEDRCSL